MKSFGYDIIQALKGSPYPLVELLKSINSKFKFDDRNQSTSQYPTCPICGRKNKGSIGPIKGTGVWFFRCFDIKCGEEGDVVTLMSKRFGVKGKDLVDLLYFKFKKYVPIEYVDDPDLENFAPTNNSKYGEDSGSEWLPGTGMRFGETPDRARNPVEASISCPYLEILPLDTLGTQFKTVVSALDLYIQNRQEKINSSGAILISLRYLSNVTGIEVGRISKILNTICFIGSLDRLSWSEVPTTLYQKTVGGHSITALHPNPGITPELVEARLAALKAAKITLKNFSSKKLEDAFGEGEAKRVYPDYYDREWTLAMRDKSEFFITEPIQFSDLEIENLLRAYSHID